MKGIHDTHPSEEQLTLYALNEAGGDIEDHVLSCPSCSRYIKEIRMVKTALKTIPDEEVPHTMRNSLQSILQPNNSLPNSWFHFSILHWYKNPFLIGLIILFLILFFYCFFVFIL